LNLEELSKQFRRLPGVGPRTAEKMAYYWLTLEDDEVFFVHWKISGAR